MQDEGYHCRTYAPVGGHRDLLAYLVRRLLENGANSSFVHQLADPSVSEEELRADPVEKVPWIKLLKYRETWAYAVGKFLIDPIWWMFLFWLPDFLANRFGSAYQQSRQVESIG